MLKIISAEKLNGNRNRFVRVINLTQHTFSQEQLAEFKAAGVKDENIIDTNDEIKALITFNGDIDVEIIRERANNVRDYVKKFLDYDNNVVGYALTGGAPFFQAAVNEACRINGFVAMASYSERVSQERVQADGTIVKSSVFKHKGFVPCGVLPN